MHKMSRLIRIFPTINISQLLFKDRPQLLILTLLFFCGMRYGEHLQVLAEQGLRNYTWFQGHFSGFCYSGFWSSLGLLLLPGFSSVRILFIIPILLSFHELFPLIDPSQGVTDIQDMLCYFAATVLVIRLYRVMLQQATDYHVSDRKLIF